MVCITVLCFDRFKEGSTFRKPNTDDSPLGLDLGELEQEEALEETLEEI